MYGPQADPANSGQSCYQDSAKSVNMVLIFEGQGALYPEEEESAFPNE